MSSLISSLAWVRRGVAARNPSKYVLDEKELERVSKLARIDLEDARVELKRAHDAATTMGKGAEGEEADDQGEGEEEDWVDEDDEVMDEDVTNGAKSKAVGDDLAPYNLDDYDDDEATPSTGPFSNIKGLQYYQSNEEDPYITLKEDDEDNEREELEVLPTDNMLIAAKTEDEISQLEVYVYDDSSENLYMHHDLMLPNFPLCLEWMDFPPTTTGDTAPANGAKQFGNFIAVGTLDPEIEIWSLDVVDPMYPDALLGRPDLSKAHIPAPAGTGKKKRKKSKHRQVESGWHVDAVLSLSWNRTHRNLLASASADRTVKLWDLTRCGVPAKPDDADGDAEMDGPAGVIGGEGAGMAIRSFDKVHKDKIQAVQWNEKEPTVLLTGSYDRTVRTFDTRAPDEGVGAVVGADVEALKWDPWEAHSFYVSLENGLVLNFDARTLPSSATFLSSPSPARFTLQAHDGAVSALDINPHIPGCIVTGGTDKVVKVWNANTGADGGQKGVSLVISRDLGVGKIFSTMWSPDDPLTLAAAGSKAKMQIWDVGANSGARKAFGPKLAAAGRIVKEKEGGGVVGVQSDDEGSEVDDED